MLAAVWLSILVSDPAIAQAQDDRWQVGTSPSFSSGRYGTDSVTEVFHTPFSARRLFDDGDVTLVLPITCVRGDGSVTVVSGAPARSQPGSAARGAEASRSTTQTTATRTAERTAGTTPSTTSGSGSTAPAVMQCGMGDIVVRARYFVLDERGWQPTVALRAHLKAPTASRERGLGTGRPDEGVGVEISRTLGGGVIAMVDGGYTLVGQPAGTNYDNVWWYDVGLGQDLPGGMANVSVFFEESKAIVPGLTSARDVLAALTLRGARGWRVQVSGQFGLSEGAPDHGFALGASRRF